MKSAVLLLAGSLLAPLPALADDFAKGDSRPGGRDRPDRIERLTERLDLSDEQTSAVRELFAEAPDGLRAHRDAMKQARESLDNAIESESFDEIAIRDAAAGVAALEADRAVDRARKMQELREILTPAQWESFQRMQERRGQGGRGMGGSHGRRGGRGGSAR